MLSILSRSVALMRARPVAFSAVAVAIGFSTFGGFFLFREPMPEYVLVTAKRGDLVQTVEAIGTVVSERDIALHFGVSGIVQAVYVREGEQVKAGQLLAQLRPGAAAASVAASRAALESAEATLRAMQEGTRFEDLAIAEAQVLAKQASLAVAKQSLASAEASMETSRLELAALKHEADVSLSGDISLARSEVGEQVSIALSAVSVIEDILSDVDVVDILVNGVPSSEAILQEKMHKANDALHEAQKRTDGITGYSDVLGMLDAAKSAIGLAASALQDTYDHIVNLPVTSVFGNSEREEKKSILATQKNAVQASLNVLDASTGTLRDAAASFGTQIISKQSQIQSAQSARDKAAADILTYEAALGISEAELGLKRAGSRPADIAAQEARVRQARADLARSQAGYGDTRILAPMEGTVTAVHVRPGELTPGNSAMEMLGAAPYRLEMFVSEVDIPKVGVGQSGSILLDAFPNMSFTLVVGEIDPAATDKEGVAKYRVVLDFVQREPTFKVGMTGDAEITTDMRRDVVSIPMRAVLGSDAGEMIVRVLADGNVYEKAVGVGMEDGGGDVEIVSGIAEGETVIVLEKE